MPLCRIDVFGPEPGSLYVNDSVCGRLTVQPQQWTCRDGSLRFSVLALEELSLPQPESSEPLVAALARVQQAVKQRGGWLIIEALTALDPQLHQHCTGCRFLRLEEAEDRRIWDALLSLGLPIYALSEQIYCQLSQPRPLQALQALLFGAFYCSNGLAVTLDESPQGCSIHADQDLEARVIVRGGLEAATLQGSSIVWQDSGHEGYVRIEAETPDGDWWLATQPRFVGGAAVPDVQS